MHAMTNQNTHYLGVPEPELLASGAVWTAREIEQQPRMLEKTHALLSALHERIDAFVGPVAANARAGRIRAFRTVYLDDACAPGDTSNSPVA